METGPLDLPSTGASKEDAAKIKPGQNTQIFSYHIGSLCPDIKWGSVSEKTAVRDVIVKLLKRERKKRVNSHHRRSVTFCTFILQDLAPIDEPHSR